MRHQSKVGEGVDGLGAGTGRRRDGGRHGSGVFGLVVRVRVPVRSVRACVRGRFEA